MRRTRHLSSEAIAPAWIPRMSRPPVEDTEPASESSTPPPPPPPAGSCYDIDRAPDYVIDFAAMAISHLYVIV
jgi:hypothetical protein